MHLKVKFIRLFLFCCLIQIIRLVAFCIVFSVYEHVLALCTHFISVCLFLESPRFRFIKPENFTTVYHEQETDVLYVGGQGVIYKLNFRDKEVHDTQVGGPTL